MTALLDNEQLQSFVAIAETGSFTKAADMVNKTQSAVSMQMKKLEERLGKNIFIREGRHSRLTDDGAKLLDYARRIVKLNTEAVASFSEKELVGRVRLGVPDDYADRYLPEIMAAFSRSNPRIEFFVVCEPTTDLVDRIENGDLDLAIITKDDKYNGAEVFRREQLVWVSSTRNLVHEENPLPLALGRQTCSWRRAALDTLESVNRPHRLLYSSWNASAVAAAVLAGLAVSVLPETALRPGMRVLKPSEGFPALPSCHIGLLRSRHEPTPLADALAQHVVQALDNLSDVRAAAE